MHDFVMKDDVEGACLAMENTQIKKCSRSLSEIPVEIVETILAFVQSPKDILNFALASKACYCTALTLLYRNIDWTVGHTHTFARSAAMCSAEFLRTHPDLLSSTRILRVSERKLPRGRDTKLYYDFSCNEYPIQPARKPRSLPNIPIEPGGRNFPDTFHATNRVLDILPRFSGLTELILRSITLPRTFYQSVHALSGLQLRRITIRSCRLTTRYPSGYDPTQLQLTELSIFNVVARSPKLKALLKLARSPTLRVLRLDRSIERALGSLVAHGLPSSVHTLELDWRGSIHPDRQGCKMLLFFLNSCSHVQHLELVDMGKLDSFDLYPANKRLKADALPSLASLAVPAPYLETFLPGRAIGSVTLTDTTQRENNTASTTRKFLTVTEVESVLKILRKSSVSLRSLKFNLQTWDKELFYMLAREQRRLKELHIAYQFGRVDDNFYMILGNLIEFPHMERLHLYKLGDNMAGTEDDRFIDQKEYMIIWQIHMPDLCEVALSPDIIWARAPAVPNLPGGRRMKRMWFRCAIEPMDGAESLVAVASPKETSQYDASRAEREQRRIAFRHHAAFQNFFQHTQHHSLLQGNGGEMIPEDIMMEEELDIEVEDFH
ncbi:uncharacterized protein FOMMEDRAFT_130977 [Fomitiporia mediterranea MF3/22]|uniref:uncharacterized protein n=1 Tax=Fomitiporia mediterranea (strain MF3/22) TaxID=694068 RepID=UPI00044097D8|nr:uncharacterized protein FOMMEDRAFT_130977 [Fomitiporia mediterranea MF3/22]EJD07971.1 hypothetical protein FOMMEDRAFT_130977 [Fomitiporia mediterranea MF3/22]